MSVNPLMLAVRSVLELCAVVSFAVYGWRGFDAPWRYALVAALPIAAAALWGTFTVPEDPSRNGAAAVAVPGSVRLLIEIAVLWGGVGALWLSGLPRVALISTIALAVYSALAYDRVGWLLRH